ncbi:glycosyltransferase [Polaribacter aestuariivivens]|uniref:glycosyltransferase n=1 Tax=Polaribacter aestuariivivens TaxID=2304626 RepID=UPI003F491E5E
MKLIHVFSAPQSAYFFLKGQIEFMTSKGIELTLIIPLDKEFNSKLKAKHKNIQIININFERNISIKKDFFCLLKLIKVFLKVKPNIIHLHTPKASLLGGLAGRLLFKKNIIYQMHGLVSIKGNKVQKGLLYKIEKLTCSLSTKIFAVSESLKEFAIQNNFCKRKKISVIENGTINGIDYTNQFNRNNIKQENEELKHITKNKFIVGFLGRLVDDKGIEDYLQTISKCKKTNNNIVGFVIGPDESNGDFFNLLKKYNLVQNIDIFVFGQQLQPQNYMIYFDILLLPTKREGFGLVGAEANALQIPVVGYDIPGFKDAVVSNKTGILVEFDNINKLYEAVMFYYNNKDIKVAHGLNGRKRVEKDFNQKLIWKSLYENYKMMVI